MSTEKPVTRDYFIYMIRCVNDTLYTGITTSMERRMAEHRRGTDSSSYTRSFPPLECAACWKTDGGRGAAQSVEKFIKSLPRERKEDLICSASSLKKTMKQAGREPLWSIRTVKKWAGRPLSDSKNS